MKWTREKELSLICCVIRENDIIESTLWQSFDTIFEIALAFVKKYGVDEIQWGVDVDMEYEETVIEFAKEMATKIKGGKDE